MQGIARKEELCDCEILPVLRKVWWKSCFMYLNEKPMFVCVCLLILCTCQVLPFMISTTTTSFSIVSLVITATSTAATTTGGGSCVDICIQCDLITISEALIDGSIVVVGAGTRSRMLRMLVLLVVSIVTMWIVWIQSSS